MFYQEHHKQSKNTYFTKLVVHEAKMYGTTQPIFKSCEKIKLNLTTLLLLFDYQLTEEVILADSRSIQ